MANQDLINYIQQSLTAGVKKEDIITTLLNIGWQKIDIDEAFRQLESTSPIYRFQSPGGIAPATEVKAKKKGLALKISIIFFIIGLLTGGAWSYYYFIQRPQLALRQMLEVMTELESLRYDFVLPDKSISGVYRREPEKYFDKAVKKFKFHKRDLAEIKSLAKREILRNINVYHYDLTLDEEAVDWLTQSIYEVAANKEYDDFSLQEKELLERNIDSNRKDISKIKKIDIYIGQNDLYLYKLDIAHDDKKSSFEFYDFNKVKSPELQTGKSIREILNDFMVF